MEVLCGKELTYQTIRAQSTGHRSRRTWILQFCEACAGQARRTISLPQIWRAAGSATYRCRYINILTPPRQRRRVRKAQQVVALLQSYGLDGTMVWWDVEDKDVLRPLGVTKLTECIRAAQEVVEAAGYGFGLYVGLYVYKERWLDFDAFAGARLWVARYYHGYHTMQFADEADQNYKPSVNRWLTAWQYTSCGEIAGIKGDVDLNISYEDPAAWTQHVAESGVIYTVSVADVWTRDQAEAIQQQLAPLGVCGVVHKVQILE